MSPRKFIAQAAVAALLSALAIPALANGTETLGPPLGITIEPGTGVVAAGAGLFAGQPGAISIDVPGDVNQALLYWQGVSESATSDDTVLVNGVPVTGSLIGGLTLVDGPGTYISTYRADITSMVGSGLNLLSIGGLDYDRNNDGAGVLVIFDDGGTSSDIQIRDGNDFAFINNAGPPNLKTMVPQTFTTTAALADRTGELTLFVSDVNGTRANALDVTVNGVLTKFVNPFSSADGNNWDTTVVTFNVPAGATMITVEPKSEPDGSGAKPASLIWNAAAFAIKEENLGDGCTPGFWRNHHDEWGPTGLDPGDDFDTTFSTDHFDPDITLGEAIRARGGQLNKVARHGTAALLNALHPDVLYPVTEADVIAAVQAGDVDSLVGPNELSDDCPAKD